MSLCIATSVFHLRKSRPLEYYLQPTLDLINDLKDTNIEVCVFTDQSLPSYKNIHVFNVSPEAYILEMWNNPNWKKDYRPSLEAEQSEIPELIAVWLGKFPMMKIASQFGDNVLWQDSGIRIPRVFQKDFSKYTKCQLYPEKYNELTRYMTRFPLLLMNYEANLIPFHGVDMEKYRPFDRDYLMRAGFMLIRSSLVDQFKDKIKEKWLYLVSNNEYGTEENALTLFNWETKGVGIMSYNNWLNALGMQ